MRLRFAFISIVIGCFVLIGCDSQNQMKESNIVSEGSSEISATGAYNSMAITYPGKYTVEFHSQNAGHPDAECDFATFIHWGSKGEENGYCNIYYYVMEDNIIENDYPDYDEFEEVMVNDKIYKVIRAEDTLTMLYKVDKSFYIRIELSGAGQFDSSGNYTEVTCFPSDYLDNGWLDKEIVLNITPVE